MAFREPGRPVWLGTKKHSLESREASLQLRISGGAVWPAPNGGVGQGLWLKVFTSFEISHFVTPRLTANAKLWEGSRPIKIGA